jgi:hypothetical protein
MRDKGVRGRIISKRLMRRRASRVRVVVFGILIIIEHKGEI